jgi:hypothetical protein
VALPLTRPAIQGDLKSLHEDMGAVKTQLSSALEAAEPAKPTPAKAPVAKKDAAASKEHMAELDVRATRCAAPAP